MHGDFFFDDDDDDGRWCGVVVGEAMAEDGECFIIFFIYICVY